MPFILTLHIPCALCYLQVDELDLARIGPMFEHNAVFPARTNTGAQGAEWLRVPAFNNRVPALGSAAWEY